MTKLTTTLRTVSPYFAKQERYFSNVVPANNTQDAIDATYNLASNPVKPVSLTPVTVTNAMSPYTLQPTDYVVLCDTSTGAITINLSASASYGNLEREIVDSADNASVNNITINPNGAEKIDTILAPLTIDTNAAGVRLRPLAAGWKVMP